MIRRFIKACIDLLHIITTFGLMIWAWVIMLPPMAPYIVAVDEGEIDPLWLWNIALALALPVIIVPALTELIFKPFRRLFNG